jgi:hypothetical protein
LPVCCSPAQVASACQPPDGADESWYTGYQGLRVLLEEQGLSAPGDLEQVLRNPSQSTVLLFGSLENISRDDWLRLRRFVAQGGTALAAFEESQFVRIPGVTTWFPGPVTSNDPALQYSGFSDVLQLPADGSHALVQSVPSIVINRSGFFTEPEDTSLQWTAVVRCPEQLQPANAAGSPVLAVGVDPSGSGGLFILAADKSLFSDGMIWHGNNSILTINTVQQLAAGRRFYAVVESGQLSSPDNSQMPRPNSPPDMPPPQQLPDMLRNPPPPLIQPPRFPPSVSPPPSDLQTILRTANALLDKLQQSDLLNRTLRDRPRSVRPGGWLRTMLLLVALIAGLWALLLLLRRKLPRLPEWKTRLMQSVYGVQTAQQIQSTEFGAAAEVLCRRFCVEVTGSPLESDWIRLRSNRPQTSAIAALPAPLKNSLEEIVSIAVQGSRISLPEDRFKQLGAACAISSCTTVASHSSQPPQRPREFNLSKVRPIKTRYNGDSPAAWLQPNGVEVLWNSVNGRAKTREDEAGMAKRRKDRQIGTFQSPQLSSVPSPNGSQKTSQGERSMSIGR